MFQHVEIVVAFEHQRVAPGETVFDMRRRDAEIGKDTHAAGAVADHVLHGLARIVRHRDRNDLEHADRESLVAVEPVDVAHPFEAVGDDGERAERRPHRRAVPRGEGGHAADMIRMLMGDEDRRQVARREPEALEARFGIANPEAAVDQHAGAAGLDDEAVALAAAAQ